MSNVYTVHLYHVQACQYITNHSEAEVVVVENEAQLSKFVGLASTLKSVKALVVYRGDVPAGTDCGIPVYTWDQFMEVSFISRQRSVDAIAASTLPNCCYFYCFCCCFWSFCSTCGILWPSVRWEIWHETAAVLACEL